MQVVVIPRKISIIPPQASPFSRDKAPEAPLLWGILKRDSRDRTSYRYEFVIVKFQRRGYGGSISIRIRD